MLAAPLLLALVLSAVQATSQQPTVPVTVLSSSLDLVEQTVTFTLRNDSDKTITAWLVRLQFGSERRGRRFGTDSYRSSAGTLDRGSHIPPGGSITETRLLGGTIPEHDMIFPHVVITPRAAIFADNSFAGDKAFADRTLERRRGAAAALREVLSTLEKAKGRGPVTLETLEFVRDELAGTVAQDKDTIWPKTFRTNVGIFIHQVRDGKYSAAQRLDFLLDQARLELVAAIAHSRDAVARE